MVDTSCPYYTGDEDCYKCVKKKATLFDCSGCMLRYGEKDELQQRKEQACRVIDEIKTFNVLTLEEADVLEYAKQVINEQRQQGHWVKVKNSYNDFFHFECSSCGSGWKNMPTVMKKPAFDYCPFCGVRMEDKND